MIELTLTNTDKVAIIDADDYERVIAYNANWYLKATKNNQYVCCSKNRVPLSRFILNVHDYNYPFVDHKNSNTLDNRKENLRLATDSQNGGNSRIAKNNSSGFKGVHYQSKGKRRWIASLTNNKKFMYLGCFYSAIEAAKAYDLKAKELFGEFARPNFTD